MRLYDLVLVLKSSLIEDQRKKVIDTIKSLFKDSKVKKEDSWGQKALSYPIRRERTGFFVVLEIEAEDSQEGKSQITKDLDNRLKTNDNILRHLLIRKK